MTTRQRTFRPCTETLEGRNLLSAVLPAPPAAAAAHPSLVGGVVAGSPHQAAPPSSAAAASPAVLFNGLNYNGDPNIGFGLPVPTQATPGQWQRMAQSYGDFAGAMTGALQGNPNAYRAYSVYPNPTQAQQQYSRNVQGAQQLQAVLRSAASLGGAQINWGQWGLPAGGTGSSFNPCAGLSGSPGAMAAFGQPQPAPVAPGYGGFFGGMPAYAGSHAAPADPFAALHNFIFGGGPVG